jgi:hypothetical protein
LHGWRNALAGKQVQAFLDGKLRFTGNSQGLLLE